MSRTYVEKVPERLGELGSLHALMITCKGCTRGVARERADLVKDWGEKGRVADLVRRFRCSNCSAKGRRPGVRVAVVRTRVMRTENERIRAAKEPVDRLMHDIERLRPSGYVE